MIGQRLTMRAHVRRNLAAGHDSWGQPEVADPTPIGVVTCFAWSPSAREIKDGDKVATTEDVRMLVALGADIVADDVIGEITDRAGAVLFAGPLRVDGPVQYKHTHGEVALRRVG